MGSEVDAGPEDSGCACRTDAPGIGPGARADRRLLGAAPTASGRVNHPTEWWHWSCGDRYRALATGADHALYGPRPLG